MATDVSEDSITFLFKPALHVKDKTASQQQKKIIKIEIFTSMRTSYLGLQQLLCTRNLLYVPFKHSLSSVIFWARHIEQTAHGVSPAYEPACFTV
jgi:hypothetical protein